MKTLPVMIRVEPRKWQALQKEATKQDLTTPQLIRRILDEYLRDTRFYAPRINYDNDKHS